MDQSLPGDRLSEHVKLTESAKDRRALVLVAAQRCENRRVLASSLVALDNRCAQYRVRTELDRGIAAALDESLDAIGESNGLPHVVPPVLGAKLRPIDRAARDRRNQRHGRRLWPNAFKRGEQLVADRVHLGAVEGIANLEEPAEDALFFQHAGDLLERRTVAGECDRIRAIHSGERDAIAVAGNELARLTRRDAGGKHPAPLGHSLHGAHRGGR